MGIDFIHAHGARGDYHYPETFGSGAAWLDYDADGWLDLYLVNGGDLATAPSAAGGNQLWRNTGSKEPTVDFVDVSRRTGANDGGYGMGVAVADVEADGDIDIFVTNVGANALLLQSGGHFTDQAVAAGAGDTRWGTATAFFDADNDGDLDLAVINYVPFCLDDDIGCRRGSILTYCDPERYDPTGDLLYRNDSDAGGPQLTDVTSEAGFTGVGRGLGIALHDVDLDGDTDLYVANDGTANLLYRNDTAGARLRFLETGLQAGVHFNRDGRAEAGMGTDFGDIDGDGWADLIVANFSRESNTLYRHSGSGLSFVDDTVRLQLAQASFLPLGFGAALFDADADGDLDLAVANGHVLDRAADIDKGASYEQPDQLFLNDATGFVEVSSRLGEAWSDERVSRTVVPGDYDNDGDEDLLITSSGAAPRLLRNDLAGGRWLTLRLRSKAPGNRYGLGARIAIDVGPRVLHRQLHGGGSYLAARPPRVHVGLGKTDSAQVTVYWPGGGTDSWTLTVGDHELRQGTATP
ncbi:MAG TPA: CRTAC1 family protein [Candidatus Latescibacteria bacterium]|nr:CRTAC1 family protein [Candidatus Latescibacterota bacterium]